MNEAIKPFGMFDLSEDDKTVIIGLLKHVQEARKNNDRLTVIKRDDLPTILSEQEIAIIDRVYSIDPKVYGFKGPKLSIEPVPGTLIRVDARPYRYAGLEYLTDVQYVPEVPYRAFQAMAQAMKTEIGRELLIDSSYRSDAYQAITFLMILFLYHFDVYKTAKRVAIPGYSEHGTPRQLALDLENVDGLPSNEMPQEFAATAEYDWLVVNAHRFDFYLSYPKGNPYGVTFEPWHWQHRSEDAT